MTRERGWQAHGPISAAPAVADLDGDGRPEIVVAADALYAWRWDGSCLPGFPVFGGNAFASRPAVADLDGDGRPEIVVGCDDNRLYALNLEGDALPGWPVETDGDVYSSPAVADLDGDGRPEVVVGSDDGHVYAWRADGTPCPGWPQRTQGFVAASPAVADLDGDGCPEVVAASWDGRVYVWQRDGALLPGWPRSTGHFVWASPTVGDVDGDGRPEILVASDRVYIWRVDGTSLPGWPRPTRGYNVAAPLLCDLDGNGRPEVVQVGGAAHAWRGDGRPLPGFPVPLPAFVWGQPEACPHPWGAELVFGAWDGGVYTLDGRAKLARLATREAPIFAPVVTVPAQNGETGWLVADWLGRLRLTPPGKAPGAGAREPGNVPWVVRTAPPTPGPLPDVPEDVAPFLAFPLHPGERAVLWYQAHHEAVWHPVPLVVHGERVMGLIQPFPAGRRVRLFVQMWPEELAEAPVPGRLWSDPPAVAGARRLPREGFWTYRVRARWGARLLRRLRRWRVGRQRIRGGEGA